MIARSGFFEELFRQNQSTSDFVIEQEHGVRLVKFTQSFFTRLGVKADIELLREVTEYIYFAYWEPKELDHTRQIFILAAEFDLKDLRNLTGENVTIFFLLLKQKNISNIIEINK